MHKSIVIIGYSGHSYVVIDILNLLGYLVNEYCDRKEVLVNPYGLNYLGSENNPANIKKISAGNYFISIGNNKIRNRIQQQLFHENVKPPINAIHPSAVISENAKIGNGVMVGPNATINSFAEIGNGTICNTACIIEHEVRIGEHVHIAPGAVLAGKVHVDNCSFVGANSVIKQGVKIGRNSIIGAGAVIITDVPQNSTVIGNPGKIISKPKPI